MKSPVLEFVVQGVVLPESNTLLKSQRFSWCNKLVDCTAGRYRLTAYGLSLRKLKYVWTDNFKNLNMKNESNMKNWIELIENVFQGKMQKRLVISFYPFHFNSLAQNI